MSLEFIGKFNKNTNHPFGFSFYEVGSEDFETLDKRNTRISYNLGIDTLHSFSQEANLILIDNIAIKNRNGESISLNDVASKSGYFVFWDEKSRILKYCSKSFERDHKIKKLFEQSVKNK